MAAITQNLFYFLLILDSKEETGRCGKSYKFALLNQSIIGSLWEIKHIFALKNPNQIRPVAFERSFRGLIQGQISDIEDSQLYI